MSFSPDKQTPRIVSVFAEFLGGIVPTFSTKRRPDGDYILFDFAYPHNRMYEALASAEGRLGPDDVFFERVSIQKRKRRPANVIDLPEVALLQKELSESLTVDRHTFGDDFLARYVTSVTNSEGTILGNSNHVVFGRRGSGKSSLLAYAMHTFAARQLTFSWIALQAYSGRSDDQAIAGIIGESLSEIASRHPNCPDLAKSAAMLAELAISSGKGISEKIQRALPIARQAVARIASSVSPVTFFLDDIHVLGSQLQAKVLAAIYSIARGNHCYIKVSGIEQFSNIWDANSRVGLEPPHDAQIIKLDHNLTIPDRSQDHIVSILDAHANYCGLPSAAYACGKDVLPRLVLVAAAVPRDALSLFSQAISKARLRKQKTVTIMAVNAAASETIEEKLRDVARDSGDDNDSVQGAIDRVRDFCIKQEQVNSFLVRMDSRNKDFQTIQKLIALRFVHVLNEGITPFKVGERYVALMLDYGFYTGARAAKGVRLVPKSPKSLTARELRSLPIYATDEHGQIVISARRRSRKAKAAKAAKAARAAETAGVLLMAKKSKTPRVTKATKVK